MKNFASWMVWVVVAGLLVALLAVGVGACSEPTTEYKGRRVTESQLASAVTADIAKAEADGKAAAEAAAAAHAAEVRSLEREAAERTRAFERQLARLVAEQQFEVQDLRDVFDASQAAVADALAAADERRESALKAALSHQAAIVADAEAARAAGQADIDKQWDGRGMAAGILAPAIDAGSTFVPGLSTVLGTLGGGTGIAGMLGLVRANRKRLSAHEAARAALAAIDMLPPEMRAAAEKALAAIADRNDMAVIGQIQRQDDLTLMPSMQKAA